MFKKPVRSHLCKGQFHKRRVHKAQFRKAQCYASRFTVLLFFLCFCTYSRAGSLYLPLQTAKEIEARIERLFVLANMPIIKRPIPIKHIHIALEKLGQKDPALRNSIQRYLDRYRKRAAFTHLRLAGSINEDEPYILANQRGIDTHTEYMASIKGHLVLSHHLAVNVGGGIGQRATEEDGHYLDGSFISLGSDYLQADIGFRAHWFGPFQDSDMLITTNAPSMPGITLSNVVPFDFLNLNYEVFWAEMSESDQIKSQNDPNIRLTGKPRLFGLHLSISPFDGFALGINRLMQYGGADRDQGLMDLFKAFFNPSKEDNLGADGRDFGNQLSSITTRYTFGNRIPLSVYMEYAGEDTSFTSDIHLGNSALMLGLHLPKIPLTEALGALDFTYEYGEWQNGWYVNNNYGDGLLNEKSIVGHWAGNQRNEGDGVGATAHYAKAIWDLKAGTELRLGFRSVDNVRANVTTANIYQTNKDISLGVSQAWGKSIIALDLNFGEGVFGEDYAMMAGSIQW